MGTFETSSIAGVPVRISSGARPMARAVVGLHGRGSPPENLEAFCGKHLRDFFHILPRGPFAWKGGPAWYIDRPAPDAEVMRSVEEVRKVLEAEWAAGGAPERTFLWGFSQGALIALQTALALEVPLAGVAAISPRLHPSASRDAAMMARARGRRFLLVHGETDSVIPIAQGEEARALLTQAGAECQWVTHGEGHVRDNAPTAEALAAFVRRVLPG